MHRGVQLAGVAALALVLVAATLVAVDSRGLQTEVLFEQQASFQQLPEFNVAGTMQTGAPAPQGIPLSFQLPVPLPAPSPPAPTVITVGPRPKKAPVCKRCERQMRKIKVRHRYAAVSQLFLFIGWRDHAPSCFTIRDTLCGQMWATFVRHSKQRCRQRRLWQWGAQIAGAAAATHCQAAVITSARRACGCISCRTN